MCGFFAVLGGQGNLKFDNLKIDGITKIYVPILKYFIKRKKSNRNFFLVRLYCQNNHKWKLPQAADKKLNSQAWNIGMTESYEEIDSSNSLLTVEHHYYLAKGSVTYMWSISRQVYRKVFCFVFQIPTQYVECRFDIQFCWFRIKKTSHRESLIKSLFVKVRIFWERHKIWKNLPLKIWRYSVTSNFKWKIFSNIVAFSEYPKFNN